MSIKQHVIAGVETIVITLLFVYTSFYLNDPFSFKSAFPWVWFAPVLVALRYGSWISLASVTLLSAIWYYLTYDTSVMNNVDPQSPTYYQLFFLGGFSLTLCCAVLQESWAKKNRQVVAISDYLQQRIQSIHEAYRVLLLSYERLENQSIMKPMTLRTALENIRQLLRDSEQDISDQRAIFERFLNIVSRQCALEIAGIFLVKQGKIASKPLVSIGEIKSPKSNDYLIEECIDQGEMMYLSADRARAGEISDYVAVAPMLNAKYQLHALLLIQRMPFLSLNNDTLNTIQLLIRYFTAGYVEQGAQNIVKNYPACPVEFANELYRLIRIQKEVAQDSAVVAYAFLSDENQDNAVFRINQEKRGLDTLWNDTQGNVKYIFLLMPLTGHAGAESYRLRISALLEREFRVKLNHSFIQFHSYLLSAFSDVNAVMNALHKDMSQS